MDQSSPEAPNSSESSKPIFTEVTPSPVPDQLANPYEQDKIEEILAFNTDSNRPEEDAEEPNKVIVGT